jgi:hypothetical protein
MATMDMTLENASTMKNYLQTCYKNYPVQGVETKKLLLRSSNKKSKVEIVKEKQENILGYIHYKGKQRIIGDNDRDKLFTSGKLLLKVHSKRRKFNRVTGYIHIGDNRYIGVCKSNIPIVAVGIICLAVMIIIL